MKCMVIKQDKSIESGINLSHQECVELTALEEFAAVMVMDETPGGLHMLYQDGVVRQYDPVSNTIIGAASEFRAHSCWTS